MTIDPAATHLSLRLAAPARRAAPLLSAVAWSGGGAALRMLAAGLIAFGAGLAGAAAARADTPFSWVAKVDEEIITGYDLQQRVLILQTEADSASEAALAAEAQEQLIEEALKRREAQRRGVQLRENALEDALNRVARGNTEAYLARFASRGVQRASVEKRLRTALLWNALLRREHLSKIEPSEDEVQTELAAAKASAPSGGPAQYQIVRMFVASGSGGPRQAAQRAEQARSGVASCQDLQGVASEAIRVDSRRMTAQQLSRMGMPEQTVKQLISLDAGKSLRPLRSPEGFHVFFNCGRSQASGAQAPSAESVKSALTNRKAEFVSQSLVADLRRDALIEIAN